MKHPMWLVLWAAAALGAAALTGCEGGEGTLEAKGPPSLAELFPKVVRGERSDDRPEVGSLSVGCTGTLVAPEVVISAAHCFNFQSATRAGNYGTFTIEAAGGERRYTVQRYVSYGNGDLGDADLALAQLAERVPAEVARPRPLGASQPTDGARLSVWGYGCTQRGWGTDWEKRVAYFSQGERTNHLCPGDSGGPVFDETSGAVVRINSGYWHDGFGTDIFGEVPPHHDRVASQVREWSSGGVPELGGPPDARELPPVAEGDAVCGLDRQTRQRWVCADDGVTRLRCKKGYAPERGDCGGGCQTNGPDEDARCVERGDPEVPCGDAFSVYVDWTCTADGGHVLRCHEGGVEVAPCVAQCAPGEQRRPDACGG